MQRTEFAGFTVSAIKNEQVIICAGSFAGKCHVKCVQEYFLFCYSGLNPLQYLKFSFCPYINLL